MRAPPVCILTAGRGTRMGQWSGTLNKALLPLDRRAAISHIIERFDPATEFVVAVGFLGHQVREYLALAHPDARFSFVEIANHDGPGSGPGRSLLECAGHLQRPFYFASCDTLWEGDLPVPDGESWIGVGVVPAATSEQYCNVRIMSDRVVEVADKTAVPDDGQWRAFAGLMFIEDHTSFWSGLSSGEEVGGEVQVSSGLTALVAQGGLRAAEIAWTDIGDAERYRQAALRFESFDFGKTNEAIYVVGDRVIKFFADSTITERRVRRAAQKPDLFPDIVERRGQFFAYAFAPGATLYECLTPPLLTRLLERLARDAWTPVAVAPDRLADACRAFYHDKTIERVDAYRAKNGSDRAIRINGVETPPLDDLMKRVPWEMLEQGIATFIHGDLQFDNILYDEESERFTLLDWRQDFAGSVEFGDLYYDLAKLRGGIILNYDHIKRNLLRYDDWGDDVFFDFAQRYQAEGYLRTLEAFIAANGWNVEKVRLLVPIIYVNMSPLHTPPFDQLLHALGRSLLAEELDRLDSRR